MRPQLPVDNHEAEMARADLYKMAKYSMKLFQMIQEGQELEGWVQAKITKASDYISSIYHYMEYQTKFGAGAQASSVEDITSEVSSTVSEEEQVDESLTYEQKLHALLEAKVKKAVKEGAGPYTLDDPKHPKFKANYEKFKKANPSAKLADFVAAMRKKEKGVAEVKEEMKVGDKKQSSTGGTIEKTKTGVKHTAGKNYGGEKAPVDKDEEDDSKPAKKSKARTGK